MPYTYTTFETSTSTSTVVTTPTITSSVTTTTTYTASQTVPVTSTQYIQGTQSMAVQNMKRQAEHNEVITASSSPNALPAALAKRQAIATPTQISSWSPKKISAACAQIATGTLTTTYFVATATSTIATSTGTTTLTQYVGTDAAIAVTDYYTRTRYARTTITYTSGLTTTTVATDCPLATQISCFTLTGQSGAAPHIDGALFGVHDGYANPSFQYKSNTVWYLTCNNSLVNLGTFGTFGAYSDYGWTAVEPLQYISPATCTQSGQFLNCVSYNGATMSIGETDMEQGYGEGYCGYEDDYGDGYNGWDDMCNDNLMWEPMWGNAVQNDVRGQVPVALVMEPVVCPCAY